MSLKFCEESEMKLLVHGEKGICKLSDCYTRVFSFFATDEGGYEITVFFLKGCRITFKECFTDLFKNTYRMPEMTSLQGGPTFSKFFW